MGSPSPKKEPLVRHESGTRLRLDVTTDQETKKITASELAEVLARVDGRTERETAPPPPDVAQNEAGDAPIELLGRPVAVIEQPVNEDQVVNATAPSDSRLIAAVAPVAEPTTSATPVAEAPTERDAPIDAPVDGTDVVVPMSRWADAVIATIIIAVAIAASAVYFVLHG